MWFICALITVLCWGLADLFYKKGSNKDDKYSHLKIVVVVGLVMGLHATVYMLVKGVQFDFLSAAKYLPVSGAYILSMAVGYIGLRYLYLSISSPVQNASGIVVAILCVIFFGATLTVLEISAIAIITLGVIGIAILDKPDENEIDFVKDDNQKKKYRFGTWAIIFPLLYCLIDGLGTFGDAIYLDQMELISEDMALVAYEFTFLIVGILCWIFLKIKKQPFKIYKEPNKIFAALFETAGQFTYVFAMAGDAVIAAPLVAAYSVFSVIFSRIFLHEKLKWYQYIMIILVMVGIVLLGINEGLSA